MRKWRAMLTSGWTFVRLLRLALGILLIVQAWVAPDLLLALLGGVLLLQAAFNVGCCGADACSAGSLRLRKKEEAGAEDVKYESIN